MRLLFLSVLLAATAPAQSIRNVRLRLLAFDTATAPKESFLVDPAAKEPLDGIEAEVKAYLNHEAVDAQLAGNSIVFTSVKSAAEAAKPENQLAKVTLPEKGNQFVLLFLPSGDGKYKILPMADSVKSFPLGAYQVISLSSNLVRLTLEKKVYDFKPGQISTIEDPPVGDNQHSAMHSYIQEGDKWQRIGAGVWPSLGKKRSIQVFFDNPISKQTELHSYRDVSPPSPSEAP